MPSNPASAVLHPISRHRLTELGIAFNASTLALALPVYLQIHTPPGNELMLRLLLLTQVLPTGLLLTVGAAIRWRSRGPRSRWIYWGALSVIGIVSLLRLLQREFLGQLLIAPSNEKTLAAIAIAAGALLVLILRARRLPSDFGQLAVVTAALTAYFLLTTGLALDQAADRQAHAARQRTDSVYILVFDELGRDVLLRDGAIDPVRYPHLAALAAESLWLTNATTNYWETGKVIPSLLTGRYVEEGIDQTDSIDRLSPNLLTELSEHYRVTVYGEFFRSCEPGSVLGCRGVERFAAQHPALPLASHWLPQVLRHGFLAQLPGTTFSPYTFVMYDEFLDEVGASEARGRAYYVHVLLPHFPFVLDETGRPHGSPQRHFTGRPEDDPAAYRNYELQVMLVDRLVGELVETLEREGLFDDATILITGDHGPRVTHPVDGELFSALTPNVPVLLKSPAVGPGTSDVDWQNVDLAPTLRKVLGLRPAASDGSSIFEHDRPARRKTFTVADEVYEFDPVVGMWIQVR